MDHSKVPTRADFENMLGEIYSLIQDLGLHHDEARVRAKGDPRRGMIEGDLGIKDGYPTRSMPESEIHGGRTSDPTADFVVALAEHDWQPPTDPVKVLVNNMNREVLDARNRLRGAAQAMRDALPTKIPDPVREECATCWVSKAVATRYGQNPKGWVSGETRCSPCSKRLARYAGPTRTKVAG